MPIMQLQKRLTQVGVIRLGEKRLSKNNKQYPAKLETFRLTSPARWIIEAAAAKYGGEVRDWPDAPDGPQFQVTTTSKALDVYVLPQKIDPNLELWGNRHRVRFCNGVTERIRNTPCLCEAAARVRYQRAGMEFPEDGRFVRDPRTDCKPTTRISVALADVGDGQWKVEAHGWNAAAELPTKASVYLELTQKAVPAVLRLNMRSDAVMTIVNGAEKVESREYVVPELDFGGLFTIREALTGGVDAAVARALTAQQERPAIEAAKLTEAAVLDLAEGLDTVEALQDLWRAAGKDEVLTAAVKQVLQQRSAEIQAATAKPADKQDPEPTPPPATPAVVPPVTQVVDAETEPDRDEVWGSIAREAQKVGWNLSALYAKYEERMGHRPDSDDATGWKYQEFLTALKAGEVAA